MEHPLKSAKVRTFKELHEEDSFRAIIGEDGEYPIFFSGKTEQQAKLRARTWIQEQLEKHEAEFRRRQAVREAKRKKDDHVNPD